MEGIGTGFKYALTNCGFLPLLLYSARDLENRTEVFTAASCAALVGVIPAIVFHVSFMVAYPDITGEILPTYWLLEQITSGWFLHIYVLVVFILVALTGVGLLQGVVESVDLVMLSRIGRPLPALGHAGVSGAAVLIASGLASIGLVALIVRAYDFLSAAFLLIFFIPLFTRGIWLIRGKSRAP